MAERIKPLLSVIVSDNQSAFIKGRCISDNIFLAQELTNGYHLPRGKPRMALKIDLMKAYDTMK